MADIEYEKAIGHILEYQKVTHEGKCLGCEERKEGISEDDFLAWVKAHKCVGVGDGEPA